MKLSIMFPRRIQFQPSPLFTAFCIFLATIVYCWIAEHTQLYQKTAKQVDARPFLLLIGVVVICSLRTWTVIFKPNLSKPIDERHHVDGSPNTTILPREQTEEWKGWMQAIILLYHYFGLSKNLPVYQVIRVLVAAYIFLTGYSHTAYFLKTNDFSIERTTKTLLRLNLLACVLAYAMNKNWDFYYFPGLTSIWYLVIFVTVYTAKTRSGAIHLSRVCISLLVSCVLIQALLYSEFCKMSLNAILPFLSKIGGPHINSRELSFRLKLDSLMPYWGGFLAVFVAWTNHEPAEWFDRSIGIRPVYRKVVLLHASWIALGVITGYCFAIQRFKDKFSSNAWHPLISVVPIITILTLRNATSRRRQGFNRAFQWLGSISLESYILQSHIWLTNNNKGLLRVDLLNRLHASTAGILSILVFWLEDLVITFIFLVASHCTAHATKTIIDWLMTGSRKKVLVLLTTCWMLNLHWKKFA